MMSVSKEWSLVSREMYGEPFIQELADFLKKHDVKTILECGCGDGNILQGLALRGFKGLGIDANKEMIELALEKSQHPNISYKNLDWLNIDSLTGEYDAVMCRGNSLPTVVSWEKHSLNKEKSIEKIRESIGLFFRKLKSGGFLYLDTTPQGEIDKGGREVEIKTSNIHLKGRIDDDLQRRVRKVYGCGNVYGHHFDGGGVAYLLTPGELEGIIKIHNPFHIFRPKLKTETNYEIVCAIKK